MKVYLVEELKNNDGGLDDYIESKKIIGVFSTEEKADDFIMSLTRTSGIYEDIYFAGSGRYYFEGNFSPALKKILCEQNNRVICYGHNIVMEYSNIFYKIKPMEVDNGVQP